MKNKGILQKRKQQDPAKEEEVLEETHKEVEEEKSETIVEEKKRKNSKSEEDTPASQADFFSLFLSGLPYTCTEDDIKEFLRECGDIKSILLPKYQDSGKCRGYAHVEFKKKKAYLKGLELNGKKIGDRYIDISPSKGKTAAPDNRNVYPPSDCTTIFVKNLPYEGVTEDTVGDKFRHCGPIKSVRFSYNWQTKKFKGFCYIDFEKPESVKKAMQMNGKQINGRNIIVDFEVGEARKGYKLNFKEEGNIKYSKIQQEIKRDKEKASKAAFRKKGPKLAF